MIAPGMPRLWYAKFCPRFVGAPVVRPALLMMSGEYDLISVSAGMPSKLIVGCVNVPAPPLTSTVFPVCRAKMAGNECTWCRSTTPPDWYPDVRLVPTATYVVRSTPFAFSVGALMLSMLSQGPEQPARVAISAIATPSRVWVTCLMGVLRSPVIRDGATERVHVGLVGAVEAVPFLPLRGAVLEDQEQVVGVERPRSTVDAESQRDAVPVRIRQQRRHRLGRRGGLVIVVTEARGPHWHAVLGAGADLELVVVVLDEVGVDRRVAGEMQRELVERRPLSPQRVHL